MYSCVICSAERGDGLDWILRDKHRRKTGECLVVQVGLSTTEHSINHGNMSKVQTAL